MLTTISNTVPPSMSAGMKKKEVQAFVEDHVKSLVLKHFDPRKADRIFTEAGSVSTLYVPGLVHTPG